MMECYVQRFPSWIGQERVLVGLDLLKIRAEVRSWDSDSIETIVWLKQYVAP